MATRNIKVSITITPDDLDIQREALTETRPPTQTEDGEIDTSLESLTAQIEYAKAHKIPAAEFPAGLINQLEEENWDADGGETWFTYRAQDDANLYTVHLTLKGISQDLSATWGKAADKVVRQLVMDALREGQAQLA